jgi:hypothetical protein
MAYTALLGLVLPTTGSLNGTWGTAVNTQITQLIEDSIAGYATASVASGNWTLTDLDGVSDTARAAILIPTGSPGVTRYINAPEQSKIYVVINKSDSTVFIRGGTTPTTGVGIQAGTVSIVAWDSNASDFVQIAGGGGATGGGANQVFFNNDLTVTSDYTIPATKNSGTFGPIEIATGVTVTVPSTSVWTIV